MSKCKNCSYGGYNKLSDICDGCRHEPDVGWGGYTDNAIGKHYNGEYEEEQFYQLTGYDYYNPDSVLDDYFFK